VTVEQGRRLRTGGGLALLLAGLIAHVVSAQAIGGTWVAYRDHVAGFVMLTLVSGAILVGLGRRFWRGRWDITWLSLGVIQALIGLFVYINRFSVHG
jgi:hypothetical protein